MLGHSTGMGIPVATHSVGTLCSLTCMCRLARASICLCLCLCLCLSSPSRCLTHAPSPSTSCHLAHTLPPSRVASVMPFTATLASHHLLSYATPHTAFGKPPPLPSYHTDPHAVSCT